MAAFVEDWTITLRNQTRHGRSEPPANAPSLMDERGLSECGICANPVMPALRQAGWAEYFQIRDELSLTNGRIFVRGKLVTRKQAKRADYVLNCKPNIPIALIEAKDNTHTPAFAREMEAA